MHCESNPYHALNHLRKTEHLMTTKQPHTADDVKTKLNELFDDMIEHDGFGDIHVEVKILKRQQKEVILHCGKQYRFVVDKPNT